MNHGVYFIPLGGGQRVGASCYYLRLGSANILLDCGTGVSDKVVFEPDFYSLLTSPFMESLNQFDQVFISHAHTDHVGYLPNLLQSTERASVYMTEMTSLLTEYQIYDKNYLGGVKAGEERGRLAVKHLLEKRVKVSYFKEKYFGQYKATFFPAGHIPGAMMILLEYKNRKILYTGDFCMDNTALTTGYQLPEYLKVDTVIMCGLHAKQPSFKKRENSISTILRNIFSLLEAGQSVYCKVKQLSKGIEFLKALNRESQKYRNRYKIFLDKDILHIGEKLERLSIPIFQENNYSCKLQRKGYPHLVLGNRSQSEMESDYQIVYVDFSLHEDFGGMVHFIKKYNPRQVVMVHCAEKREMDDFSIEQQIMLDGDCNTQFVFAEEKEIYQL